MRRWTTVSFVLPFTTPNDIDVFAVEDTVAQISWRRLGDGEVGAIVHHPTGTTSHVLGSAATAGAADITGFTSGAVTVVDITLNDRPIAQRLVTTEPTLDDGPTTKIATNVDAQPPTGISPNRLPAIT